MKWFKSIGWMYFPVHPVAYLITLLLGTALVHDFIFIDAKSASVSDTYYSFSPYGFMYIVTWLWIAAKTSTNSVKN